MIYRVYYRKGIFYAVSMDLIWSIGRCPTTKLGTGF